jgi:hypothetical protein
MKFSLYLMIVVSGKAKILGISKSIVEFNVTKQLRQKENFKELVVSFFTYQI